MKTFAQRTSSISDCERKFGKLLFGETEGEADTRDEMRIRESMKRFFGTEWTYADKQDFVRAFRELKACTNHFPKELVADENALFRGTRKPYTVIKEMKNPRFIKNAQFKDCLVGETMYESRFLVQSWTPKALLAKEFALGGTATGSWKTDTKTGRRTTDEASLGTVFFCRFSREELLFSTEFLEKFKRGNLGIRGETEIVRISNDPIPATVFVPFDFAGTHGVSFRSRLVNNDPEIREILLGIGGKETQNGISF